MLRKRRCCGRCQRAVDVTTSDALHHVTVAVDTNASTVWLTSAETIKMAFRQRSHKLNTTRTVPPILHYYTMSMELSATSSQLLACSKVTWWRLARTPTLNRATICLFATCHWAP